MKTNPIIRNLKIAARPDIPPFEQLLTDLIGETHSHCCKTHDKAMLHFLSSEYEFLERTPENPSNELGRFF